MRQGQPSEIDSEDRSGTNHPAADGASSGARKSAALWRAVAGMAMSLALACVIVAAEFSSRAVHRANYLKRRVGTLSARVHRMEAELSAERARVASMRDRIAVADAERAVMLAPDLRIARLSPPAGSRLAGGKRRPSATLALSRKEGRAVLRVEGLRPPGKTRVFALWLSPAHGGIVRAVEFRTAANGRALVSARLPGHSDARDIAGAAVTIETGGMHAASPSKAVVLRGSLSR